MDLRAEAESALDKARGMLTLEHAMGGVGSRMGTTMRDLVHELCSEECAGRAPGTPGGIRARGLVRDALRKEAGLDPAEQSIGRSKGANLIATIPGDVDRWVMVAAHYDHLGGNAQKFYAGADDNAAAVAILVEVAKALNAKKADGRGVIVAAFDAEEPPYFLTGEMGSQYYVQHASEVGPSLDKIDMMVCMDLVGHALGGEGLPEDVRGSLFALGAERSEGTSSTVDQIARAQKGLIVRRADAEIIPPLSDYHAFWTRKIPFLFLTSGRSARYHTIQDTPDHLDWKKMSLTAKWLESFVRQTCAREDDPTFKENARDDLSTLQSFEDLIKPLAALSPLASTALTQARDLIEACDADGRLPSALQSAPSDLVLGLESALA